MLNYPKIADWSEKDLDLRRIPQTDLWKDTFHWECSFNLKSLRFEKSNFNHPYFHRLRFRDHPTIPWEAGRLCRSHPFVDEWAQRGKYSFHCSAARPEKTQESGISSCVPLWLGSSPLFCLLPTNGFLFTCFPRFLARAGSLQNSTPSLLPSQSKWRNFLGAKSAPRHWWVLWLFRSSVLNKNVVLHDVLS